MKPLKTEVAFATPWFQILGKTMREGEAPYYSLRLPDYVAVVALTEEERVLIVRQYRPAVEHDTLELPSGLVDPGETPEERRGASCWKRRDTRRVRWSARRHGDRCRTPGQSHLYLLARGVRLVEGRTPEEGIEVMTWSLEELAQAIADGRFDHALHVAVVLIAMVKGGVRLPGADALRGEIDFVQIGKRVRPDRLQIERLPGGSR